MRAPRPLVLLTLAALPLAACKESPTAVQRLAPLEAAAPASGGPILRSATVPDGGSGDTAPRTGVGVTAGDVGDEGPLSPPEHAKRAHKAPGASLDASLQPRSGGAAARRRPIVSSPHRRGGQSVLSLGR